MSAPIPETEPMLLQPGEDDKLTALHAEYAAAKAQRDAAEERFKTVSDRLKTALFEAIPEGERRIELRSVGGRPLRLVHSESWRIDSTRLKRESPETYVRYAKKSESWSLRVVGGEQ